MPGMAQATEIRAPSPVSRESGGARAGVGVLPPAAHNRRAAPLASTDGRVTCPRCGRACGLVGPRLAVHRWIKGGRAVECPGSWRAVAS